MLVADHCPREPLPHGQTCQLEDLWILMCATTYLARLPTGVMASPIGSPDLQFTPWYLF